MLLLGSEDPGGTLHVLILDDSVSQDKLESKQTEKNRSMEKYYSTGLCDSVWSYITEVAVLVYIMMVILNKATSL